nr:hypothetical protein GCM10020093_097160 [Planobispora longispora]
MQERAGRVTHAPVLGEEPVDPVVPGAGVGLEEGVDLTPGDAGPDLGGGGTVPVIGVNRSVPRTTRYPAR